MSWSPVLTDDFTGTNDDPPDPQKWTVANGGGGGSATIQSNQLRLQVDGSTAQNERGVQATGMLQHSTIRIDGDVTIPGAGHRFFNSYHVRHNTSNDNHYYVMIARLTSGSQPIVRINKNIGGSNTVLSLADFPLSDGVAHYRFRAQIVGFTIRGAVRDFASGEIPEGVWDITADDNDDQDIPGTGLAQINMTNLSGDGTDAVLVDNIVVSEFVAPLWSSVFSDEFTDTNGDPWDAAKWATYDTGDSVADIQNNQGRLLADGDDTSQTVRASAILGSPRSDIRVEFDITLPASGQGNPSGFFANAALRIDHTTTEPSPDEDNYSIQIRRQPVSATNPQWKLTRNVGGSQVDLTTLVNLTNGELTFRVRFECVGSMVRSAIRPFSAGPIAEGDWDVELLNAEVTQAGTCRLSNTHIQAASTGDVRFDNVVISELPLAGGLALLSWWFNC